MGFMDKVKAQAEQAVTKAQAGVAQGQTRIDDLQAKRSSDALLRDLGAAYYASQRTGGSPDAVATALAAVDAHAQSAGPVDTGATTAATPAAAAGTTASVPASTTPPPPAATGGSFSLDDI